VIAMNKSGVILSSLLDPEEALRLVMERDKEFVEAEDRRQRAGMVHRQPWDYEDDDATE
jgi:hypothetical protein